jgi:hypothetical protein
MMAVTEAAGCGPYHMKGTPEIATVEFGAESHT